MTGPLVDAIIAAQTIVKATAYIDYAPDMPPEQASVFPFSVCYPDSGQFTLNQVGWSTDLHKLILEIHYAQTLLAPVIHKAVTQMPLIVQALFADPTWGGAIDTISGPVEYLFGELEYGSKKTIGTQLTIPIKIQTTS
jgi:hypothetical protein